MPIEAAEDTESPQQGAASADDVVQPKDLSRSDIEDLVRTSAESHGVDPDHMVRLAKTESSLNQSSTSSKGASGVMQLMPGTAIDLGVDRKDPYQNIHGGVSYFRQLLDQFGGDYRKATAAYNAGPGRVSSGKTLPAETQDYVSKIMPEEGMASAEDLAPEQNENQGMAGAEDLAPASAPFTGPQQSVPGMEQLGGVPPGVAQPPVAPGLEQMKHQHITGALGQFQPGAPETAPTPTREEQGENPELEKQIKSIWKGEYANAIQQQKLGPQYQALISGGRPVESMTPPDPNSAAEKIALAVTKTAVGAMSPENLVLSLAGGEAAQALKLAVNSPAVKAALENSPKLAKAFDILANTGVTTTFTGLSLKGAGQEGQAAWKAHQDGDDDAALQHGVAAATNIILSAIGAAGAVGEYKATSGAHPGPEAMGTPRPIEQELAAETGIKPGPTPKAQQEAAQKAADLEAQGRGLAAQSWNQIANWGKGDVKDLSIGGKKFTLERTTATSPDTGKPVGFHYNLKDENGRSIIAGTQETVQNVLQKLVSRKPSGEAGGAAEVGGGGPPEPAPLPTKTTISAPAAKGTGKIESGSSWTAADSGTKYDLTLVKNERAFYKQTNPDGTVEQKSRPLLIFTQMIDTLQANNARIEKEKGKQEGEGNTTDQGSGEGPTKEAGGGAPTAGGEPVLQGEPAGTVRGPGEAGSESGKGQSELIPRTEGGNPPGSTVHEPGKDDLVTGDLNPGITKDGEKEAATLAEKVSGPIEINVSPMDRAKETVAPIKEALGKAANVKENDAFGPMPFGEIQGQPQSEVKDQIDHYITHPDEKVAGTDGTFGEWQKKLLGEFHKQADNWQPGEKILNLTHSIGVQLVQAHVAAGAPKDLSINTQAMIDRKPVDPTDLYRYDPDTKKMTVADNTSEDGIYFGRHAETPYDNITAADEAGMAKPPTTKELSNQDSVEKAKSTWYSAWKEWIDVQQTANTQHSRADLESHFLDRPVGDVGMLPSELRKIGAAIGERDPEKLIRMTWRELRDRLDAATPKPIPSPTVQQNVPRLETLKPEVSAGIAEGSTRVNPQGGVETLQRVPLDSVHAMTFQYHPGIPDNVWEARGGKNTMYPETIQKFKENPSPVAPELREAPDGKYVIWDGHHRVAAAKERGDEDILAWTSKPGEDGLPANPAGVQKTEPSTEPEPAKEPAKPEKEYSSTQVNLPADLSEKASSFSDKIPDSELAEKGRETEHHITALFGTKTNDAADVAKVLKDERPIRATIGKVSVFPADEKHPDYDVVILAITSPDLARVNKKLRKALPNENEFPGYTPHLTLAYVKPGEGAKYAGQSVPGLTGQTVVFPAATFSSKTREHTEIPLGGKAVEKPAEKAVEDRFSPLEKTPPSSDEEAIAPLRFWLREIESSIRQIDSNKGTGHDERVLHQGPVIAQRLANWIELHDNERWKAEQGEVSRLSSETLGASISGIKYDAEHAKGSANHYRPYVEEMRDRLNNYDKGNGFVQSSGEKPAEKPTNEQATIQKGQTALADEILRHLRMGQPIGNNAAFQAIADQAFGGSRAQGKYDMKQAYDAMEAAINRYIADHIGPDLMLADHKYVIEQLRELMAGLPTQNIRSEQQELLQQFSTPPTLSYVTAKAAGIRQQDTVLEPSGGTGSLAAWAKAAGAIVHGNEIDPDRRNLFKYAIRGTEPTGVDAELLNVHLPQDIQPTVVIMNPPFSATGGRVTSNSNKFGYRHVIQALKRLQPGGRLVAILGEGATPSAPTAQDFWKDIGRNGGTLRANIGISGKEYAKYGTTFGNRLIIIDKVPAGEGQQNPVTGDYANVESAYAAIAAIANDRPTSIAGVGQPSGPPVGGAGSKQPVHKPGSKQPQPAPTGEPDNGPKEGEPGGNAGPLQGQKPATGPEEEQPAGTGAGGAGSSSNPRVDLGGMSEDDIIAAATKALEEQLGIKAEPEEKPAPAPAPGPRKTPAPAPGPKTTPAPAPKNAPAPAPAPGPPKTALSDAAAAAKERLLKKLKGTQLQSGIDPQDLVDMTTIGANKVLEGHKKFKDWAAEMLKELGDFLKSVAAQAGKTVDALLRQIHELAAKVSKRFGGEAEPTPTGDSATEPLRDEDLVSLEARKESELKEQVEDDGSYVQYVPTIQGLAHPGQLVETKIMASVTPPPITYQPNLPKNANAPKPLSAAQMESVARAGMMHQQFDEDGKRLGVLIGDSMGVGKGQQLAAIIWDRNRSGQKKAIWVSAGKGLANDAKRDFLGIGANDLAEQLHTINDWDAGDDIDIPEGVLFSTYHSLIAKEQGDRGKTRMDQIIKWLGEDGVIIFDEAHKAKNAVASGPRGVPSKMGQAVNEIQDKLPKAYVVYASATSATDVANLGYMGRLGLWGKGTSFRDGFNHFLSEIGGGGVAAMELISREMKALGRYLARSISYKGINFEEVKHPLSDDQKNSYDTAVRGWQTVLNAVDQQIKDNNAEGTRVHGDAMQAFWGTHQRFFRRLLMAMKVPTIMDLTDKALDDNKSVVISLIGTGAAQAERQVAQGLDRDDLDFSPKESLINMIKKSYPTIQYEEYTDPNTGRVGKRPVLDAEDKPVQNPEAVAKRDALIKDIDENLKLPDNPIDFIIRSYGRDKVAELTSRRKTIERNPTTGKWENVSRAPDDVAAEKINEYEMDQFQSGKKRIAIISKAAGTGISLHADLAAENQQPRFHIVMELSWSADDQMQSFGRTHRSNQKQPPEYAIVSTDAGGEKRFSSTIARRLESLGALTKGQRDASGGGSVLAKYNFETDQGVEAARAFYLSLLDQNPTIAGAGITGHEILERMGVLNQDVDHDGNPVGIPTIDPADLLNVTRLLNRILNVEIADQNAVYDYFVSIFDSVVKRAIETGTLDTGVKMVKGDHIKLLDKKVIAKDPQSGAETYRYLVEAQRKVEAVKFEDVGGTEGRMYKRLEFKGAKEPDQLAWARRSGIPVTNRAGTVEDGYLLKYPYGTGDKRYDHIGEGELNRTWEPIEGAENLRLRDHARKQVAAAERDVEVNKDKPNLIQYYRDQLKKAVEYRRSIAKNIADAKAQEEDLWNEAVAAAPTHLKEHIHMIGGSVLRLWSQINATGRRMDIRIAYPDEGGSVAGVVMREDEANQLEGNLTGTAVARTPESIFEAVLTGRETFNLAGGIRLAQWNINRQPVVEIQTRNSHIQSFVKDIGAKFVKAGWQDKYYIPNDPKVGIPILKELLKQYPLQQPEQQGQAGEQSATQPSNAPRQGSPGVRPRPQAQTSAYGKEIAPLDTHKKKVAGNVWGDNLAATGSSIISDGHIAIVRDAILDREQAESLSKPKPGASIAEENIKAIVDKSVEEATEPLKEIGWKRAGTGDNALDVSFYTDSIGTVHSLDADYDQLIRRITGATDLRGGEAAKALAYYSGGKPVAIAMPVKVAEEYQPTSEEIRAAQTGNRGERGAAPMLGDLIQHGYEALRGGNFSMRGAAESDTVRGLGQTKRASPIVHAAMLRAASPEARSAAIVRASIPLIRKALGDSDVTVEDLFRYYVDSRLRGLRERWQNFSDQSYALSEEDMEKDFNGGGLDGSASQDFVDLLKNLEGRNGIPENPTQVAASLIEQKDWAGLRDYLASTFQTAANSVRPAMLPDEFDYIRGLVKSDPQVKEADRIYGERIETPLAENHALNEGIFSDAFGPANRYFPLIATEEGKPSFMERLGFKKPRNSRNVMATGLSKSGYTVDIPRFRKAIERDLAQGGRAAVIQAAYDAGLMRKVPRGNAVDTDTYTWRGREYPAEKVMVTPPPTIIRPNGPAVRGQAVYAYMPTWFYKEIKDVVDKKSAGDSDPGLVRRVLQGINTLALQGPADLTFHTANLVGALILNTPFLSDSLGGALASSNIFTKKIQAIAMLATTDPTSEEAVQAFQEMAEAGALPTRYASVTYSKELSKLTGAKLVRWTLSPFLYGPKGVDARARYIMWKVAKAINPDVSPKELNEFVNQLGNYTPALWSDLEKKIKYFPFSPFYTAGSTMLRNGINGVFSGGPVVTYSGKGSRAPWIPRNKFQWKLWHMLTVGTLGTLGMWFAMSKELTGKYPWQDKRSKLLSIPVGQGNGPIDKFRHTGLGNTLWGTGPEVGYLNVYAFNPLMRRGMAGLGLPGAYQTMVEGGGFGLAQEAAQRDILNTWSHPVMGPEPRAAIVGMSGKEPYLADYRDRNGRISPQFLSAIPDKSKPGFETNARKALAAAMELNAFTGAIGDVTGARGNERRDQEAVRWHGLNVTATLNNILNMSVIGTGLVGGASNPFARSEILRQQRAGTK